MKRYLSAFIFGVVSLTSQLAHADIIDDAIGNIQQAVNDAYNPGNGREDNDRSWDDRGSSPSSQQYNDRRRQLDDRRRQIDDRQRQLDQERRQIEDEERRLEEDYDR
ncbi:DDRRRQL repeat protein YjdP [Kluyvera intermedia]|jgi:hypothetical protein|uniref:Uncharacterized protein YjdP n=1 Tax=Kluyvera intermedia TaxID=61648 RepID=A0ABX6DTW1_KLUIN|nr:DDRRRQL repeat protein YjdP [Kluyvera intermedia]QGH31813.1 hypothetical protein GHC21_20025 [Kluyvera intermedia]QGH40795.1 hypothetical protein GHC38_20025 [Kluyvera intermedia]